MPPAEHTVTIQVGDFKEVRDVIQGAAAAIDIAQATLRKITRDGRATPKTRNEARLALTRMEDELVPAE